MGRNPMHKRVTQTLREQCPVEPKSEDARYDLCQKGTDQTDLSTMLDIAKMNLGQ